MRSSTQVYQRAQIETCSRGDLLLSLMDGAIRYAHTAQLAIQRCDPSAKGHALTGAINILGELTATLNPKGAEVLCSSLKRLYAYLTQCLQRAGLHMQSEPIDEVLKHLQRLRDTWAQAIVLARQSGLRV